MSDALRKKAVEMLLKGATLLAEPCPYCSGVRVLKDGNALCVSCGREPDKEKMEQAKKKDDSDPLLQTLQKKLDKLTEELDAEKDYQKQQQILQSINALVETIQKIKK
ncbi:MAG: Sjogren's syndrome/scleroderma autoantigen 1 family protein [Candidatus Nitrosotenuis sp.]|uniref:Sjogrens syndrome scleroderma autoantigen 1 n=1 Tax=Candidatus Nitrosotenuis uzonensis TaxID=1407055 RepID=A0A812F461_9ARCH|nr:Sjogren's syndrome/scleroderma autoantigen 1 family protein [Candidatus Nitrosotenuis uzonensis]CAE6501685.1 Sjogrens syndrome scleroderma autoantigen 1 [Candidatus Nitrosotenuis uzonensis]